MHYFKFYEVLFCLQVGGRVMEALSKDLALQGVAPTQYMPPSTSTEHHWGVQVRLWDQTCPRCSLPFADNVLLKQGGVRVFPRVPRCLSRQVAHCLFAVQKLKKDLNLLSGDISKLLNSFKNFQKISMLASEQFAG